MDKLLFRAWNEKEKIMYPVICINLNDQEVIVDKIVIRKEYKKKILTLRYKYPKDVVLLQYIGVKDINKKKIFKGDIIRWKIFEEIYSPEKFIKNDYITGVIEWNEEECCFMVGQITEGMNIFKCGDFISENFTEFYDEEGQQRFDWNRVEIIGNKFADPDLLKRDDIDTRVQRIIQRAQKRKKADR